ncbi:MAG: M15 family metallopeptidase [Clostridiales Family XIII bacterium]|nr:M15 family metallopeptidase [Clostridiales Family XIII bacterium]
MDFAQTKKIAVIVLLALAPVLFMASCDVNENGDIQSGDAGSGDVGSRSEAVVIAPGDEADSDTGVAAPLSPFEALWYYEAARAGRYDAFAAARPELAPGDVVWMVDADLDIPAYTDTHEAPDPDSLHVLVNKHFSLPDDYVPADLVDIGATMMRAEAAGAMQEMIDAAQEEGLTLWSQSGFRSYGIQVSLYNQYSARDGSEAADTYSARPGFSEHQTGLTTDLNTITDAFGDTPEGVWVAQNCWRYGYIVRYTKENTDVTLYKPEPWHMRYIGQGAAAAMRDLGILSFEEYSVKYIEHTPPGVG